MVLVADALSQLYVIWADVYDRNGGGDPFQGQLADAKENLGDEVRSGMCCGNTVALFSPSPPTFPLQNHRVFSS